jgi:hypothetical protein
MDNFAGEFFFVTLIAKRANVFNGLKLMFSSGNMTYGTLADGCRTMNVFLLTHVGMAFRGDTGFFFHSCSIITHGTHAAEDNEEEEGCNNDRKK